MCDNKIEIIEIRFMVFGTSYTIATCTSKWNNSAVALFVLWEKNTNEKIVCFISDLRRTTGVCSLRTIVLHDLLKKVLYYILPVLINIPKG